MSCPPALVTLTVPVKVIAMTTPNTTSEKRSVGSRTAPSFDLASSVSAMVTKEHRIRAGREECRSNHCPKGDRRVPHQGSLRTLSALANGASKVMASRQPLANPTWAIR